MNIAFPNAGRNHSIGVTDAKSEAERQKTAGMTLAAAQTDRKILIFIGQIALLDAILDAPDQQATTDAIADDLSAQFGDGGKWRGSIPKGLAARGLITKVGWRVSDRVCRHRGPVILWQANVPEDLLILHRRTLRQQLAALRAKANKPTT